MRGKKNNLGSYPTSYFGNISNELRDEYAERVLQLCQMKNYRSETMHLALNIFDIVLRSERLSDIQLKNLPILIVTVVILAAKIE